MHYPSLRDLQMKYLSLPRPRLALLSYRGASALLLGVFFSVSHVFATLVTTHDAVGFPDANSISSMPYYYYNSSSFADLHLHSQDRQLPLLQSENFGAAFATNWTACDGVGSGATYVLQHQQSLPHMLEHQPSVYEAGGLETAREPTSSANTLRKNEEAERNNPGFKAMSQQLFHLARARPREVRGDVCRRQRGRRGRFLSQSKAGAKTPANHHQQRPAATPIFLSDADREKPGWEASTRQLQPFHARSAPRGRRALPRRQRRHERFLPFSKAGALRADLDFVDQVSSTASSHSETGTRPSANGQPLLPAVARPLRRVQRCADLGSLVRPLESEVGLHTLGHRSFIPVAPIGVAGTTYQEGHGELGIGVSSANGHLNSSATGLLACPPLFSEEIELELGSFLLPPAWSARDFSTTALSSAATDIGDSSSTEDLPVFASAARSDVRPASDREHKWK
ncbi:unnamed protein product [Amoebophrya sp. A120]|nr:unnamed protein product [Amoebophrya sp. A120]|eukprot:GSA120T00001360001.1